MSQCSSCGAPIDWIHTTDGKAMPVDAGEFAFVVDPRGDKTAVLADGSVAKGRIVSESNSSAGQWIYARTSHFATCPNASEHRRIKR